MRQRLRLDPTNGFMQQGGYPPQQAPVQQPPAPQQFQPYIAGQPYQAPAQQAPAPQPQGPYIAGQGYPQPQPAYQPQPMGTPALLQSYYQPGQAQLPPAPQQYPVPALWQQPQYPAPGLVPTPVQQVPGSPAPGLVPTPVQLAPVQQPPAVPGQLAPPAPVQPQYALPQPDAAGMVAIPVALHNHFLQVQAESQRQVQAEADKARVALAKEGQAQQALDSLRAEKDGQIGQLQGVLATTIRDNLVNTALYGLPFVSQGAHQQVVQSLSQRYSTMLGPDGRIVLRDLANPADTTPVTPERVRALVTGPEFSHNLAARHQGGAPPNRGGAPSPTPPPGSGEAPNLAEQVMQGWYDRTMQYAQQNGYPNPVEGLAPPGWGQRGY